MLVKWFYCNENGKYKFLKIEDIVYEITYENLWNSTNKFTNGNHLSPLYKITHAHVQLDIPWYILVLCIFVSPSSSMIVYYKMLSFLYSLDVWLILAVYKVVTVCSFLIYYQNIQSFFLSFFSILYIYFLISTIIYLH